MIRPALLLAAGAMLAAPAFAQTVTYGTPYERVTTYSYDPVSRTYVERNTIVYDEPATVTYVEPAPVYSTSVYSEPDIVVTAPRAREDDLITMDVVDRIATDPRISGQVGVDTYRNNVTLTGRVTTPGMVDRAERDAKSVPGVREVENRLRPRVGG